MEQWRQSAPLQNINFFTEWKFWEISSWWKQKKWSCEFLPARLGPTRVSQGFWVNKRFWSGGINLKDLTQWQESKNDFAIESRCGGTQALKSDASPRGLLISYQLKLPHILANTTYLLIPHILAQIWVNRHTFIESMAQILNVDDSNTTSQVHWCRSKILVGSRKVTSQNQGGGRKCCFQVERKSSYVC